MAKRKLHGAALAAHKRKLAREGHSGGARKRKARKGAKRSKKRGRKRGASKGLARDVATLKRTVHHHSQLWNRQRKLNTVFRDSIRNLYSHSRLSTPASVKRLRSR